MLPRRTILTAACALALWATNAVAAPPDFTALDTELAVRCADGRFSGVVTVTLAGDPVFQRTCGDGVSATSRFKIFSTSKLLTALTVLSLVEDGRMALDASVATYIADLPPAWKAVTVRQLLDHTSGLPDETNALLENFASTHADAMQALLAARQSAHGPQTPPGETWRYNNFGYELLAHAVALVEDQPFDIVLRDRVFRPGQMADALAELAIEAHDGGNPSSAPDPRLVTGYIEEDGVRSEAVSYSFVQLGAGAVHATAADLVALERSLIACRIVTCATWSTMVGDSRATSAANPTSRYGLGLMIGVRGGLTVHGHTGGTNGYISTFRRYPQADAALIALSNFGWAETRWMEDAVAVALSPARAP